MQVLDGGEGVEVQAKGAWGRRKRCTSPKGEGGQEGRMCSVLAVVCVCLYSIFWSIFSYSHSSVGVSVCSFFPPPVFWSPHVLLVLGPLVFSLSKVPRPGPVFGVSDAELPVSETPL